MARLGRGNRAVERLLSVFDNAGVTTRHFVHPPEWYTETRSFEERNGEYLAHGLDLATRAASNCLASARCAARGHRPYFLRHDDWPGDAKSRRPAGGTPRIAGGYPALADLWPRMCGWRGSARPCIGRTAVGTRPARADRLARTVQFGFSPAALTPADVVGAALFGDGAAAVLISGDDLADADTGPRILATPQGAFNGPRSGQCWSSLPSNLRPCRLRYSSSFSRSLAG